MVSRMDQLTVIGVDKIRDAIRQTNYIVENRLKMSRTVYYKKTVNICTDNVPYPTSNATIVSMAPELSLATIGTEIPVIEVPDDLECPTLQETAFILTVIGQMVTEQPPPRHTIADLGDTTRTNPHIYDKGHAALRYCLSRRKP